MLHLNMLIISLATLGDPDYCIFLLREYCPVLAKLYTAARHFGFLFAICFL